MKAYLLNLWDRVRTSYWAIPLLFTLSAALLSVLMPLVDHQVDGNLPLPQWIKTTTETARESLSSMGAAIVTVVGSVFSITIVTLSLTSQQFGPRLLRRFLYDLPTQLTLGVFIATATYCLLLLRVLENRDGVVVPHLSVMVGILLGMASILMLILFINRVTLLIQAPHVVASVAHDLHSAIKRLFPESLGDAAPDDAEDRSNAQTAGRVLEEQLGNPLATILSTQEGYVQALAGETLMELARSNDLVFKLARRPGHFINRGMPLAKVWAQHADKFDDELHKRVSGEFNEAVIVGLRRTPRQDVECAVEELVEVAVRSLSPGINDPFTAINCIDRLGAALGELADRRLPDQYRYDSEGKLRVIAGTVGFPNAMEAAFNQIRQHGSRSVAVTIRLLEAMASIARHVSRTDDKETILHHADMVARHAENFDEEYDRRSVQEGRDLVDRVFAGTAGEST